MPDVPERNQERAALVTRLRRLRVDIQQIFDDADHWNRVANQERSA